MTSPATVDDVEDRWRPLEARENVNAQVLLEDAWREVRRKVPGIESRLSGDDDLNGETIKVLANAVLRVLKNPDGNRRESIDDYTWERDQAVAAGLLYVTDEELTPLREAPVGYLAPLYVISLGG